MFIITLEFPAVFGCKDSLDARPVRQADIRVQDLHPEGYLLRRRWKFSHVVFHSRQDQSVNAPHLVHLQVQIGEVLIKIVNDIHQEPCEITKLRFKFIKH